MLSTKVSGYSCAFQYAYQCLIIQPPKGSVSSIARSCRYHWPSKVHSSVSVENSWGRNNAPHVGFLVKLVLSSNLFHPGEAAAGEGAVEKDRGIRTAAEDACILEGGRRSPAEEDIRGHKAWARTC